MQRAPLRIGFGLATVGAAVLAAPAAWEGPVLVEISPGRAIALLDAFGIVPLTLGSAILYRELWVRRRRSLRLRSLLLVLPQRQTGAER